MLRYGMIIFRNCFDAVGLIYTVITVPLIIFRLTLDFSACLNHNYRELVNGFLDWVDALVTSGDMDAYRRRFNDGETLSWWQSLAYKPGYKCCHCMGVCPAGSATMDEYISDPDGYAAGVVRPLIERVETIYAVPGSDTEKAALKNPAKKVKPVLLSR